MKHFAFRFLMDARNGVSWRDNLEAPQKAPDIMSALQDLLDDPAATSTLEDRLLGIECREVAGPYRCKFCGQYFGEDAARSAAANGAAPPSVCSSCGDDPGG